VTIGLGAKSASFTSVKKAFENLKDQVDVMADALGEPLLKPLRSFIETLNKGIVKPLTDDIERSNSLQKRLDKIDNSGTSFEEKLKARGKTLKEYNQGAHDSQVGAGMPNLLGHQEKAVVELDKKYESVKNFDPANKDSLVAYYTKSLDNQEPFRGNVADTFGGKVSWNDLPEILRKLSEVKDGGNTDGVAAELKALTGGKNNPTSAEMSVLVKDAKNITEPLVGKPRY